MDTTDTKSHQNYELLIRIDEQLKNLTREVRDNNTEMNKKVTLLDEIKLTKAEFVSLFSQMETLIKDHEERLRINEKTADELKTQLRTWGTALAVGFSLLQIFLKFI